MVFCQSSNIQVKFTTSFQKFSDDTSMHGFTELYYAKTNFWKITWVLVMGVAFGMTTYQICLAVNQYRSSNTGASFERAQPDHVIYPPIKFCIAHWLHWIDWYKVDERGFSKEALLIGMSYLTNIYSNHSFNIQDAQKNFTETFKRNNFTTIQSFYKSIARDIVLIPGEIFKTIELLTLDLNNVYLCYTANGSDVIKTIRSEKSDFHQPKISNTLKLSYFDMQDLYGNRVTPAEYNSYMAEWIVQKTNQYNLNELDHSGRDVGYAYVEENYSDIQPPHVILIDGYSKTGGITLSPDIDEYWINVKMSAHVWKNTKENRCEPSKLSFRSNSSCFDYCSRRAEYCPSDKCARLENVLLFNNDQNEPDRLCQNRFYFLQGQEEANATFPASNVDSTCIQNETTSTERYNQCVSNSCVEGCEKWTFDFTVTTRSMFPSVQRVAHKDSIDIYIQYPSEGDILIMTEIDSQTWENFVGNVGGLLGIWTGASIISFFQLFYLCCCSETEDPVCWPCFCKRHTARLATIEDSSKNNNLKSVNIKIQEEEKPTNSV